MEIRLPESAGSIASTLKEVVQEGSLSDLGGAVAGGLLYQLWTGVITIPLGVAEAFDALVSPITGGLSAGVGDLSWMLGFAASMAWGPLDGGLFSLVLNVVVLLVAMWIVVRGVRVIQDG